MNNIFTFFRESSLGRFLIPLGIILIVFSFFVFKAVDNTKDYVETEAIVSKVELYEEAHTDAEDVFYEATYTVYVKYTVDGIEYEEEYGVFSGYKVGDKFTIVYNPLNPKEIAQPNTVILPIIILVFGIVSLVIGVYSIVKAIRKHKDLKFQEERWNNGK